MMKFIVLDNSGGSAMTEKEKHGVSFRVFNNRIDAWAHLIEHDNGPDARVAQIEIKIIEESGVNE